MTLDNRLYVCTDGGHVHCFNALSGDENIWPAPFAVPGLPQIEATPAVADDGTIYVGDFNGNLSKIGPAGVLEWATLLPTYSVPFTVAVRASPLIVGDFKSDL